MHHLKLNLTFHARQPLFHGSDEDAGNVRTFRRERVRLDAPEFQESTFANDVDRREAILDILEAVFVSIDFDNLDKGRVKNIWAEFTGKIKAAASSGTRMRFIDRLCRAFQVEALKRPESVKLIDRFSDYEFLSLIREQAQYLSVLLRARRDYVKEQRKGGDLFAAPQKEYEVGASVMRNVYDEVPVISGNAIRGVLRRLGMRDYVQRIGMERLNPEAYHQLFTGGTINKSTEWNDVGRRRAFIEACPIIAILGAATGNQTIQSKLKMGGARLRCKENGTGELSWRELVDVTFQTRNDSAKLENDLDLDGIDGEIHQMIYHHEVIVMGAELDAEFSAFNLTPLQFSAAHALLAALLEQPYLGGNSARGFGLVDVEAAGVDDLAAHCELRAAPYYEYLAQNKERICEFYA